MFSNNDSDGFTFASTPTELLTELPSASPLVGPARHYNDSNTRSMPSPIEVDKNKKSTWKFSFLGRKSLTFRAGGYFGDSSTTISQLKVSPDSTGFSVPVRNMIPKGSRERRPGRDTVTNYIVPSGNKSKDSYLDLPPPVYHSTYRTGSTANSNRKSTDNPKFDRSKFPPPPSEPMDDESNVSGVRPPEMLFSLADQQRPRKKLENRCSIFQLTVFLVTLAMMFLVLVQAEVINVL